MKQKHYRRPGIGGRPPKRPEDRTLRTSVSIQPVFARWLKSEGGGSVSAGLRVAWRKIEGADK